MSLPVGKTGSSFLFSLLQAAVAAHPNELAVDLPTEARAFKARLTDTLPRFEATRVAQARRCELARFMVQSASSELLFRTEGASQPLCEYVAGTATPFVLSRRRLTGRANLVPQAAFAGASHTGEALLELIEMLRGRGRMTEPAAAGLRWIVDAAQRSGGRLDLSGRRFAILGAGAELAPTELLLAGGATVLWIDVREPPAELLARPDLAGELCWVAGGSDLLADPRAIAATIAAFAGREPVDMGLYAYAGGRGLEWRLTASMNLIVSLLPPELVRSVSLLLSPTTPCVVQAEDAEERRRRHEARALWEWALHSAGVLRSGSGHVENGRVSVTRSIVGLQGGSYQAAQYVAKLLTAESLALYGSRLDGAPVTVSANVAPITRTRSMSHPLFLAAFHGARRFGVDIFGPESTRWLSGLLMLHDILNPAAPGAAGRCYPTPAARAAALFSQQIHGGLFNLPYEVEPLIRLAAIVGLAAKPRLLLDLHGKRGSGRRQARTSKHDN